MVIGSCSLDYDLWGASWYFVPVLLTGVALILMLVFQMPRWLGHLDTGHSLLRCCGDMLGGVPWFRDRLRSICPGYARCNRSIRSPSPDRLGHNPAMPKVCGFKGNATTRSFP